VVEKIEDIVQIVFLPLYFTLSGLKTNIFTISSWQSVCITILVLLLASVGKMAGCTLAARMNGVPPRESLAVGVLMNTRGWVGACDALSLPCPRLRPASLRLVLCRAGWSS
jgi:Kef-type K+ transport system membrane component KefB